MTTSPQRPPSRELHRRNRPGSRSTSAWPQTLRGRTSRDRYLLDLLADHRVLTTGQVAQVWNASLRRTQRRLHTLHTQHVILGFRPYRPVGDGSSPYHWVLGSIGADEIAAQRGLTRQQLGYTPHTPHLIAYSRQLGHQVGVNGLFTALIHTAHHTPNLRLDAWWPTARWTAEHGDHVRPDAYGTWTRHNPTPTAVPFLLEHDTGTEPLDRLTAKLDRYRELLHQLPDPPLVLFRFLSPLREAHARQALAATAALRSGDPLLAVATTHLPQPPDRDPSGPVWLPLPDQGDSGRVPLAELLVPEHNPDADSLALP
jgi:hypothetical protein